MGFPLARMLKTKMGPKRKQARYMDDAELAQYYTSGWKMPTHQFFLQKATINQVSALSSIKKAPGLLKTMPDGADYGHNYAANILDLDEKLSEVSFNPLY